MKRILNRKVLIAALVIASVLLCASLVYILVMRPAAATPDLTPAAAVFTIIPGPTSTPQTLPPTLSPFPPTPSVSPTPAPGQIAVGVYVQVSTGVDALNLRGDPGMNATPLYLAFASEVFLVTNGPQQADGYTWWYLTASYDTTRAGWADQEYLTVIPSH